MRRAAFWSGAEAAFAGAIALGSTLAISRRIGPAETGTGAAAVAAQVLLWVGLTAAFADAIVQRRALTSHAVAGAGRAAILAGLLAAAAQTLAGAGLAKAYDDPRLLAISCVLAAPFPLVGAGAVSQGLLTRRRCYRALALRTLFAQGTGAAVGVVAALADLGAWAPAVQQATAASVGAAILLGLSPLPLHRRADWRAAGAMLRLGATLAASTAMQAARYRVFAMALGAVAGAATLGQVHLAFRMVDTLREGVASALWRLLLPVLAPRQGDGRALLAASDAALAAYAPVLFPAFAAIPLIAGPTVAVVLGPAWSPVGAAAGPLAAVALMTLLIFAGGAATIARGRAAIFLWNNAAGAALTAGACLLQRPATAEGAAAIWAACQVLTLAMLGRDIARALGVGWSRPIRAGIVPLLLAAGAAAVGALGSAAFGEPGPIDAAAQRVAIAAVVYALGLAARRGLARPRVPCARAA